MGPETVTCHFGAIPPQTVKTPRAEDPQPRRPSRQDRVNALAGLLTRGSMLGRSFPSRCCATVVHTGFAHRLQLRGQSWSWPKGRTTFPFHQTANRLNRSKACLQVSRGFASVHDARRRVTATRALDGFVHGQGRGGGFEACRIRGLGGSPHFRLRLWQREIDVKGRAFALSGVKADVA